MRFFFFFLNCFRVLFSFFHSSIIPSIFSFSSVFGGLVIRFSFFLVTTCSICIFSVFTIFAILLPLFFLIRAHIRTHQVDDLGQPSTFIFIHLLCYSWKLTIKFVKSVIHIFWDMDIALNHICNKILQGFSSVIKLDHVMIRDLKVGVFRDGLDLSGKKLVIFQFIAVSETNKSIPWFETIKEGLHCLS